MGLSQWVQLCTWSPNKLRRFNCIFSLLYIAWWLFFPVSCLSRCRLSFLSSVAFIASLILSFLFSFPFELFLFFYCVSVSCFAPSLSSGPFCLCLHFPVTPISCSLFSCLIAVSFVSLILSFRHSVSKKSKTLLDNFWYARGWGRGRGREGEGGGRVTSDILNPINPTQQNIFSKSEHFHFLPSVFTDSSAFCKLIFFLPQKTKVGK